jgi:N-acetylneuraminic acid mutarotase
MRRVNILRRVAAVVAMVSLIATGPVPTVAAAASTVPAAASTPGTWAATGSLPQATGFAPAVLLNDGTVITAGGTDGASFTAAAERFSGGTWTSAGSIGQAVAGQVAALLPDGDALFAGGADAMSYYTHGDVFDPGAGTWTQTPAMAHAHAYAAAASLANGDVMVIGGYDGGDTFTTGAVDIYSAADGTWSAGPALPGGRYAFTATTLSDGRVLVAGGDDGSLSSTSALSSVEIYTPGSGGSAGSWAAAESMHKVRLDQAAVLLKDGRVLVAGGVDASGTALNSAEVYDPTTGHWTLIGSMTNARAGFTLTVLPDGQVVAAGGYGTNPSQALNNVDLFDPTSDGWTGTGSLVTGRRYQTATPLADGSVLVIGGHGASSDYLASCEIYTPPPAPVIYPATTFHPLDPVRILDTRVANGANGLSGMFSKGVPRRFQVAGRGGVPAMDDPNPPVAVTGILTTTASTASGYLTIGPVFTAAPTFSTLNFPKGDNRANNVAVALDADGMLSVVYIGTGKTHALFDVTGYFTADDTGATFFPIDPGRVLDSRNGTGLGAKVRFVNKVAHQFQVTGNDGVPAGALAVTGNLTVVGPSAAGWAFVGPKMPADPGTLNVSTVNSPRGDTRADGVTVKLASDGSLWAVWVGADGSSADVVFDVTGYFAKGISGGSEFVPLEPIRVVDTRYNLPFTGPVSRATPATITLAGHGIIPASATGVSGNLTVTLQSASGFLAVAPHFDSGVVPETSTLNFPKGDNRANGFFVSLYGDGSLAVLFEATRSASTHFIIDLTGYFVPGP